MYRIVRFIIPVAFVFFITPRDISSHSDQLSVCNVQWLMNTSVSSFSLRQQYRERLNLPIKNILGYQSHDDTSSKSGSTTKNMYSV